MARVMDSSSDMSTDEDGDSEVTVQDLIRCAQHGLLDDVEALVTQYGLDVNELDYASNWTALQIASFHGRTEVVKFLIENGAEVSKPWTSLGFPQWSAIHFASSRGHQDVVELLLSCGASVSDREHEGKQPIHLACENGHTGLVKFLLTKGATVQDTDTNGFTPIIWACLSGNHELVVTLISLGAMVNERAFSMARPISVACSGGHKDIVLSLIAHGADVNDYEVPRMSPLFCASRRGQHDVVMTLLAHGAQVKNRDFSKWNPLHPACAGAHYEVVKTLLNQGVNVESYDEKGQTPILNVSNGICPSQFIRRFMTSDKAYTLRLLLEHGLNPNKLDMNGLTTFERVRQDEWALYNYDKDVLALLLDYGVAPEVPCRVEKCDCKSTVLMCWYIFFNILHTVSAEARETVEPLIDAYEKYFIKTRVIGLRQNNANCVELPPQGFQWNQSTRDLFREDCLAEVNRMKEETIGTTSTTYFSLLIRDLPALRHQQLFGLLNSDDCRQAYPIYGNMLFSSYVRLRRLFLVDDSLDFFTIFSPPLLPECAEVVLNYLSTEDLENVVKVYREYQIYLDEMSNQLGTTNRD